MGRKNRRYRGMSESPHSCIVRRCDGGGAPHRPACHRCCRSPRGYLGLLAVSNAAGSIAETVEAHSLDRRRLSAERLTPTARQGYGAHLALVGMIGGGHPIPHAAASNSARVKAFGLDPAAFLTDNNSIGFATLRDLLVPGPTYTNVNDLRAIVVDRP